jgi:release factor glutamine methyltransferase
MKTAKVLYSSLFRTFKANRIENPRQSTIQILEKVLHKPRENLRELLPSSLSQFHFKEIAKLAQRRLKHEPIQFILGGSEFRGLNFELEIPLTIPDHSSEMLVDVALDLCPEKEKKHHILEVGCGCGALSLSMLHDRPESNVVAIDESLTALELTARNYYRVFGREDKIKKRLKLVQSNYPAFTKDNVHYFDLIISNPPIIPTNDWENLHLETKLYTRRKSIDGGKYGLDAIWELIRKSADNLNLGGHLIFTLKPDQMSFLNEYFQNHNGIVHNLQIDYSTYDHEGKSVVCTMSKVAKKPSDIKSTESESEINT